MYGYLKRCGLVLAIISLTIINTIPFLSPISLLFFFNEKRRKKGKKERKKERKGERERKKYGCTDIFTWAGLGKMHLVLKS